MSVAISLKNSRDTSRKIRMVGGDMGARHKDDFYPTPRKATESLLSTEKFEGKIWEPACGDGAITNILLEQGHDVISTDLVDRGLGGGVDFLMEWQARAPNIITNPPFKLGAQFVEKAMELTTGKVAMLSRITFLETPKRAALFTRTPLAKVLVFSERLTFTVDGRETHGGGMLAFAWFVWDHSHTGPATIGWL